MTCGLRLGLSSKDQAPEAPAAAPRARRRQHGQAARRRSAQRLLDFQEAKRRALYADCQLRVVLHRALKRLRWERMWTVKRAWAEGRMVAPSLSVVADYTQSEKASCAASKGSYREALLSTCDAAHSSTTDSGADAKRVNATPPVRRAVCALQVCSVCGFMPITCKTRGCGARPKSSGGSERPSVRKSTRVRKPKSISLLCS